MLLRRLKVCRKLSSAVGDISHVCNTSTAPRQLSLFAASQGTNLNLYSTSISLKPYVENRKSCTPWYHHPSLSLRRTCSHAIHHSCILLQAWVSPKSFRFTSLGLCFWTLANTSGSLCCVPCACCVYRKVILEPISKMNRFVFMRRKCKRTETKSAAVTLTPRTTGRQHQSSTITEQTQPPATGGNKKKVKPSRGPKFPLACPLCSFVRHQTGCPRALCLTQSNRKRKQPRKHTRLLFLRPRARQRERQLARSSSCLLLTACTLWLETRFSSNKQPI